MSFLRMGLRRARRRGTDFHTIALCTSHRPSTTPLRPSRPYTVGVQMQMSRRFILLPPSCLSLLAQQCCVHPYVAYSRLRLHLPNPPPVLEDQQALHIVISRRPSVGLEQEG